MNHHLLDPGSSPSVPLAEPPADEVTVALCADLGLDDLLDAAGGGDGAVRAAFRCLLLTPASDPTVVQHRADVLADCARLPELVAEVREVAHRAVAGPQDRFMSLLSDSPANVVRRAVGDVRFHLDRIGDLGGTFARHRDELRAEGWHGLDRDVSRAASEEVRRRWDSLLDALEFPDGVFWSGRFDEVSREVGAVAREVRTARRFGVHRVVIGSPSESFVVADRDQGGMSALSDMTDDALVDLARRIDQVASRFRLFFAALAQALDAFSGAVRLEAVTADRGPWCRADPARPARGFAATGLWDPGLALRAASAPQPNDIEASDRPAVVITGANGGGKTTLLRAIGIAHLLAGAGLRAPAQTFCARPATGVVTHFARGEDETMTRGRFDDELTRLHRALDRVRPGGLVLLNETMAGTNDREGSILAAEVVGGVVDGGAGVCFVSHLVDVAGRLDDDPSLETLFLRADRAEGAEATFRLHEGRPRTTAYAQDVYERVLGPAETSAPADGGG